MLNTINAILLGIIQGITEWLPVSSSGHLVIIQNLLKIEEPLGFDILLHLGTLLVVIFFMRKELYLMLKSAIRLDFSSEYGKLLLYTLIATIPIGIAGLLFEDIIEQMFSSTLVVGIALLMTGTLLFITKYFQGDKELSWKNTALIGISQAFALVPGISRSGTTISAGLLQGIDHEKAARFSFVLSIPAILGATLLNITEITQATNLDIMLYGFLASIMTGYISIRLLLRIIKSQKFHYFSYYCWALGILLIALV